MHTFEVAWVSVTCEIGQVETQANQLAEDGCGRTVESLTFASLRLAVQTNEPCH